MIGATVAPPSRVTPTSVTGSVVTKPIEVADVTVAPSARRLETMRGAVLSMRMPVTTSLDVLLSVSVTVARRS